MKALAALLPLSAALLGAQAPTTPPAPTLGVERLRTEREAEPLDLETRTPRFSWNLVALDPEARGLAQSAYRILVASTPAALAAERGELWDSGTVASSESLDVPYAGRPLGAFEHAFWCVRVLDAAGTPSAWSAPAHFALGALDPADWSASWIGDDAPLSAVRAEPTLEGASWLCAPGGGPELWIRRRFRVPAAEGVRAAVLVAGIDACELFLNGVSVARLAPRPGETRGAEIVRLNQVVPGENLLAARVRRTGGPAALIAKILVRGPGGEDVASDAGWRVLDRAVPGFETPGLDDAAWPPAALLGADEIEALGPLDTPTAHLPPPRLLRGGFIVREGLARATLYASALGTTAIEINGVAVGEDWFAPGWTDYARRVPYRATDVTALVREGDNMMGVVLADGWFAGFLGKRGKRDNYGAATRFFGQMELEYADGTRERFVSDSSWRARPGPWIEADLYMGERYDARAEILGWSTTSTPSRLWVPVASEDAIGATLVRHGGSPVRVVAEVTPVAVTEPVPGRRVYDLGQNLAGVCSLVMEVPPGTTLVLRHGESLAPDGTVYRGNLTWARAVDRYHARGGGRERWHPRFTYHGFRYVEVLGLPEGATLELSALALSSAREEAGGFRSSDDSLNRLVDLARWTLRANSMDVPTDCPQRGERLGWTGDAQLFAPSALWLSDLRGLYAKFARDLLEAQLPDGDFPAIAPGWETLGPGGPAWADAGVLLPERLWRVGGDRRLLERHLASMRRFVDLRLAQFGAELRAPEQESFGDWGALGPATPLELLASAYLARDLRVLATVERELGNAPEAERRTEARARLVQAFARDFLDGEGRLKEPTQTALALALREGLLPEAGRAWAGATLAARVREQGITTGFVGTPELLPALELAGAAEVAYGLLARREPPSWGYMLARGATTVWERWDAVLPEGGLARGGRVSLSHVPLASFVAWLFEGCAGLRPQAPGFRSVRLAPVPGGALDWAEASHETPRGRVALRWERAGEALLVTVEVPPGIDATLELATTAGARVREGDRPLAEAPGVRVLAEERAALHLGLGSGRYRFEVPEPVLAR